MPYKDPEKRRTHDRAHREELRVRDRTYRQAHRRKVTANKRANAQVYYQAHKEVLFAWA